MKRILLSMLMVVLFVLASGFAFAAEPAAEAEKAIARHYGTVTEVRPYYDASDRPVGGKLYVTIDEKGSTYTFIIDEETYVASETVLADIKEGDSLAGFYDPNLPTVRIFPPRYHALVVSVNSPVPIVDVFSDKLLNSDETLVLKVGKETKIVDRAGKSCDASALKDKMLVVYAAFATHSMPAKTTPTKIVVLDGAGAVDAKAK